MLPSVAAGLPPTRMSSRHPESRIQAWWRRIQTRFETNTFTKATAMASAVGMRDPSTKMNEVWHVRHGERCDEVHGPERQVWLHSRRYKNVGSFDPVLTCHGHSQAARAGLFLKGLSFDQQPGSFDIVYTSPLVRAVQTAVCVSQGLGNLPLQVVPGLCSRTAALARRHGNVTARHMLMTDAEIAETFPWVAVLPRDPLAPTSFSGAAAWLTAKAQEKWGTGGNGGGDRSPVSRILAVGHREGIKAMSGRKVPTPHCCIGIFRTQASQKPATYELHDLLSREGKSLLPMGKSSSYARPLSKARESESNGCRIRGDDCAVEALAARVMALTLHSEGSKPTTSETQKRVATGGTAGSGAVSVVHTIGAASPSTAPAVGKGETGVSSSASSIPGRREKTRVRNLQPRRVVRERGNGRRRQSVSGGVASKAEDARLQPSPPRAREGGSRRASAATTKTRSATSDNYAGDVENVELVWPRGGACAGRGFRVVRNSLRRACAGGGSSCAGVLGIPADVLCGACGVLSFLSAPELCTVQTTCTQISTAAVSKNLWSELYSWLPKDLRNRSESDRRSIGQDEGEGSDGSNLHPKTMFVRAVSTATYCHAARISERIAVVKRRLAIIHNLRASVACMKAKISVRLNGEPVSAVQTTGKRSEAWVSRSSLLSEPSVNRKDGVRTFCLSSSIKLQIPANLKTVKLLRSMSVVLSWLGKDAALVPRTPVLRIDDWPSFSQIRLLGTSADGTIALYDVAENSNCKRCGSGSCRCTTRIGSGSLETQPTSPALRGCALLGVLRSHRQEGKTEVDAGIAFLTIHFPHDLLLRVATRRSGMEGNLPAKNTWSDARQNLSYGDDSAGPRHGLENLTAAISLRTAGVPIWEKASTRIGGRIHPPHDFTPRRTQAAQGSEAGLVVACFDILRPGANGGGAGRMDMTSEELTLSTGPGLPFSAPCGLSGVVADVLLSDFTICDPDGVSIWAFSSPMVFEACLTAEVAGVAGATGSSGGIETAYGGVIAMGYREVKIERRRGTVVEPGVGKVIVELALMESLDKGDDHVRARSEATRGYRCPAGHVWMIQLANVELELDFVNAWFGTNHGSIS